MAQALKRRGYLALMVPSYPNDDDVITESGRKALQEEGKETRQP